MGAKQEQTVRCKTGSLLPLFDTGLYPNMVLCIGLLWDVKYISQVPPGCPRATSSLDLSARYLQPWFVSSEVAVIVGVSCVAGHEDESAADTEAVQLAVSHSHPPA